MMRNLAVCLVAALATPFVLAAPILPTISAHDFNFGAGEPVSVDEGMSFYDPRGTDSDYLTLHADQTDRELTAYWQVWPVGGVPLPIFNSLSEFGGDIAMALEFDGEDANPGLLDVSLTGKGRNQGADVMLYGAVPTPYASPAVTYQLLLAIDIEVASLYGNADDDTFAVEGIGIVTAASEDLFGPDNNLVGSEAAIRGHVDFLSLNLPARYSPDMDGYAATAGGYSGEAGITALIPEPASLLLLLGGLGLLRRR